MTIDEYNLICSDHDFFSEVFGKNKGRIAHLPHIIVPAIEEAFRLMMSVVDRPGGIWTEQPRCDENKEIPNPNQSYVKTFRLWALGVNREQFLQDGGITPLGHMGLVFDVSVDDKTLSGLLNCSTNTPQPHLDERWDYVIENINAFRWAYVTIAYEDPLAAFIVRPSDSRWVNRLTQLLDKQEIPHTRVVLENGRETWHLSDELRKLCRLDYEAAKVSDWKPAEPEPLPMLSAEEENTRRMLEPLTGGGVRWTDTAWGFDVATNENLLECCRIVEAGTKEAMITAYDAVTDDGLQRMPTMEKMVKFSTGYPVTVAGILELARQPNLRALRIDEIRFSAEDLSRLKHFAIFPKLEELDLDDIDLTQEEIERIKSVDTIKTLVIGLECVKGATS